MNILFISSLYPTQPKGSGEEITLALHHMARYWNHTENVLVIRPVYIYPRELLTRSSQAKYKFFKSWLDHFRPHLLELDNVKTVVFPILKIPKIAYFYYPLFRFLDRYRKTAAFIPDIVVAHYNKSLDIGYQYSQRHHLPLVAGIHAAPDVSEENPVAFTARCGRILEAAGRIACRSNTIYNKICTWFPAYRGKSFVAFSGIAAEIIADKSLAIEKLNRWNTPGTRGKISMITVSSLIVRKHIDSILQALADLPNAINWSYTIIGDGPERPRLEALAKSLNIHSHICFKGNMDHQQVLAELRQTELFLLISSLETLGLVYLEAMATGNIVVGATGEGIDGIIQNGHNGFLSPAGQAEPLAILLEKIILHMEKEALEKIVGNAHDTILSLTDEQAAQHYLQHLKELLDK